MYKKFDDYRIEMINMISKKCIHEGEIQSQISNLDFYFSKNLTEQINIMYEPSLCVILQGEKAVGFGDKTFRYNSNEYLVSSTHLPAKMKILQASDDTPYLSLRVKFSLEDIYDLLKSIDSKVIPIDKQAEQGLFFDTMNIELYESLFRLIQLQERPLEDIEFLSPLLIKEVLYNLAKSKGGYFLKKFAMEGTISNKIVKAITQIKSNFNDKFSIKELADTIGMSESSLYQHFKTITTMTPIQFQKKLRLEEAKQLLQLRNMEVSDIAFQVGYESPSQFSREFSRMFGVSPKRFVLEHQKSS